MSTTHDGDLVLVVPREGPEERSDQSWLLGLRASDLVGGGIGTSVTLCKRIQVPVNTLASITV